MSISASERRQIENEMIFRRKNEKVSDDLSKLDAMQIEDDNLELITGDDLQLHFKCECSDEDCDSRIPLKISKYQKIHTDRDSFIIKPDHQVEAIEEVVRTEPEFCVVVKNKSVPEPDGKLRDTPINNT